ncbi:MAG: hemolysin III family protein [Mogibacterium sp.]|nr:hemolysin III family protein [Mogibacterium sp.]
MIQRYIKDPGSAITHFIGMAAALILMPFLVAHTSRAGAGAAAVASVIIFMVSMILLYGASTSYHTFDLKGHAATVLKRTDHMMIFVLIAGSYTPFCVNVLEPRTGRILLVTVWAFAAVGMIVKFFWVYCPKWFSSVIYLAMGWLCLFAFPQFYRGLSTAAFVWLVAGGILYSVGGVIYALKFVSFNERHPNFGNHEIFHLFVLGGSLCHFISAWLLF